MFQVFFKRRKEKFGVQALTRATESTRRYKIIDQHIVI